MNLRTILIATLIILGQSAAYAHYMWIETNNKGKIGKSQVVHVFFGEYTYGLVEDPAGEAFANVKNFSVWVLSPSGKKSEIQTNQKEISFQGTFTPTEKGTYTVFLNNDEIDVIDYTKYDFGIFKTHYHSTASVTVGKETSETKTSNASGLNVVNISKKQPSKKGEVSLKVFYQNEPVVDTEVTVFVKDLFSRKIKTNEHGEVTFSLPFETKYIVEVTTKEEVPGEYKGESYEFIWHCATYCINL